MLPVLLVALPVLQAPFSPSSAAKDAEAVLTEVRTRMKAVQEAYKLHISFGKSRDSFDPHLGPFLESFTTRLRDEKRPEVRQALAVARLYLTPRAGLHVNPELCVETLREVPPGSPSWSLEPSLLLTAVSALEDAGAANAYLAEALAKNPDREVRGALLRNRFEEGFFAKDEAQWKDALAKLDQEFPKETYTREAHRTVEAATRTAVGVQAPAFQVQSLENPKVAFTNGTFKGKYLLLDFWATWCGPCRGEMPMLHAAFRRYHAKGLEVLSLSFDRRPEDIAPFRAQEAHPMPWHHAFVEGGFQSPLAEAYGVRGIPKPILIGPDGKILATETDLRGGNLERTLEKFLGKP